MDARIVVDILNKELDANIKPEYYDQIDTWRQWWSGRVTAFHRYREMQASGKSKWRELYTLKMAKKVCEDWASALLNEQTRLVVDDAESSKFLLGEELEQNMGGLFRKLNFWSEANALVEKAFYSGTGAFLMKLDGMDVSEDGAVLASSDTKIRMEYLPAMCIFPLTVERQKITEVAFASEKTVRGKPHLYVEIHTREKGAYKIRNMYFKMDNGRAIRTDLPTGIEETINTGSEHPFFSVIRPNIVNPYEDNHGLGCAVFSQAIDNLKGVDYAYNNFVRDIWLGGKKVFYNGELVRTIGQTADGTPITLTPDDAQQSLFQFTGNGDFADGKNLMHEFNPDLRVQANRDSVQAHLDYLSFKCGLGARQYRFDTAARSLMTATQYTGEKQELKQNAAKHGIIIESALQDIARAILWAGKNILGLAVNPDAPVSVEFADGYFVSDEERRAQSLQEVRDGLLQPWEYRVKWYSENEKKAKAAIAGGAVTFGGLNYPAGEGER